MDLLAHRALPAGLKRCQHHNNRVVSRRRLHILSELVTAESDDGLLAVPFYKLLYTL